MARLRPLAREADDAGEVMFVVEDVGEDGNPETGAGRLVLAEGPAFGLERVAKLDLVGVFDATEEVNVLDGHTVSRLVRGSAFEDSKIHDENPTILTGGDYTTIV